MEFIFTMVKFEISLGENHYKLIHIKRRSLIFIKACFYNYVTKLCFYQRLLYSSSTIQRKDRKKIFSRKSFRYWANFTNFRKKKKKIRRNLFRKNFCSESTQFLFVVEFLLIRHCKKI